MVTQTARLADGCGIDSLRLQEADTVGFLRSDGAEENIHRPAYRYLSSLVFEQMFYNDKGNGAAAEEGGRRLSRRSGL